ncbi:Arabinan endo-1,5-alpha-L-arabinosidase [Thermobaculum terrenum ATCC BAA-798]|uniref:Arabinan endo-1,5-alpha-L-arabinosidase n=1 Tax=Thermobaculum terrenum (strain ATCC BAA-798 / CCMEE 7001 / YNP1) TaxID=525904 RepID=D1CH80_THET1|nr:family 43 glycosylhydrolase [Thermobaculum terrenum]ACZ43101.1 Arabinan endo-1,5-alpha-L-arabinosidase [Thermobaculum terrenum ATCC BAA-798]
MTGITRRTLLRYGLGMTAGLALAGCGGALSTNAATSPRANRDIYVHDPSFIEADGKLYVFSTGYEPVNDGTIMIRRSTGQIGMWELIGTVFDQIPQWIRDEVGDIPNLWAPDISFWRGKYHLYYAGSTFGTNHSVIGLATNVTLDPSSPDYEWVDEGLVFRSTPSDNYNAIDPELAIDADGHAWLAFGSFWDGIKMIQLDPDTGKPLAGGNIHSLASRGGGPIEAPAITYHDGYYYLFVSFDFCCRGVDSTYKIMVGRSQQITGPYVDKEGKHLLEGGGSLLLDSHGRFVGPGGEDVYAGGGEYLLVHHYYDAHEHGAPKLQIRKLSWDGHGWPRAGGPLVAP